MVHDVVAFFGAGAVQVACNSDHRLVTFSIMDRFKIGPAVMGSAALAYMYHLCGGYIVSNQDSSICVTVYSEPCCLLVPQVCMTQFYSKNGDYTSVEAVVKD
jgi:hypothetical protein